MGCSRDNPYVNYIPDMEFFQGDTFTIPFRFVSDGNVPITFKSTDVVKWYLCPFGAYQNPVIVLSSENENEISLETNTGIANVNINDTLTSNLGCGKYTQQPVIYRNGKRYLRAEGTILFKQKIIDM